WRWGRRAPEAIRRVHRLLALCGLAFAGLLMLGWAALAARGEWVVPVRFALPVVAFAGAVVFLRRLRPALAEVGREVTSNGRPGRAGGAAQGRAVPPRTAGLAEERVARLGRVATRPRDRRRALHPLGRRAAGHDRAAGLRGATPRVPEDGGGRPTRRRDRPR